MQEWLIILVIVLVLFGGKKIPELMRGFGQGVKAFKDGMNETANNLKVEDEKPEEQKAE